MNEIPMYLFIVLSLISFLLLISTFKFEYPINLITGMLNVMLGYLLSKVAINGQLTQAYGDSTIQNAAMGWIFMFLALISVILTIKIVFNEINYQLMPELEAEL